MSKLNIIAAVGENMELGLNNQLLCHLPADLKHFKSVTSGFPIIMGRKTWILCLSNRFPTEEIL